MIVSVFAIVPAFGPGMEDLSHALPNERVSQFQAKAGGALVVVIAYRDLPLHKRRSMISAR